MRLPASAAVAAVALACMKDGTNTPLPEIGRPIATACLLASSCISLSNPASCLVLSAAYCAALTMEYRSDALCSGLSSAEGTPASFDAAAACPAADAVAWSFAALSRNSALRMSASSESADDRMTFTSSNSACVSSLPAMVPSPLSIFNRAASLVALLSLSSRSSLNVFMCLQLFIMNEKYYMM